MSYINHTSNNQWIQILIQICLFQTLSSDLNMTEISPVTDSETEALSITQGRGRYSGDVKAPRGTSMNDVVQKSGYEV